MIPNATPRTGFAARARLYAAVACVGTPDDGPASPIDHAGAAVWLAERLMPADRDLARAALAKAGVSL